MTWKPNWSRQTWTLPEEKKFNNIWRRRTKRKYLPSNAKEPFLYDLFTDFLYWYQSNKKDKTGKKFIQFKDPFLCLRQFLTIESPLKVIKNVSYFMLKVFSFLRSNCFCPDFLFMWKNGLIKTLWLISKFMTSQTRNWEKKTSSRLLKVKASAQHVSFNMFW